MDKDQVEGRIKQAGGDITGDEGMQRDGEDQETWGNVKDKADDAKDSVGDKVDDIKDKF